jgi:hypothetical protein
MERLSKRTEQLAMVSAHAKQTSGANPSNRYTLATPLAAPLPVSALRCFILTIQGLWAYSSSSRCLDQIPRADWRPGPTMPCSHMTYMYICIGLPPCILWKQALWSPTAPAWWLWLFLNDFLLRSPTTLPCFFNKNKPTKPNGYPFPTQISLKVQA